MTESFHAAHAQDHNRAVSLMAKDQYMRELRWLPPADREEEALCIERIKRGLFERTQPMPNQWRLQLAALARTRLVEIYQPIIVHLATSLSHANDSFDLLDLVNEGSIGLLNLLDKLDAYENVTGGSLNALAFTHIRGAMSHALRDRNGMVHLPEKIITQMRQLAQVNRELGDTLQREPTVLELADAMQLSVEKVLELLDYRKRRYVESLEGLLEDGDAEDRFNFVRLYEEQVHADVERVQQMSETIQAAMATALTARQQEIVRVRYGFDEGPCKLRSNRDVASILGVRANTIQASDRRAKERLSRVLAPVALITEQEQSA